MDEKYFIAKIAVETVDNESGKVKVKREEKLVDFAINHTILTLKSESS